MSTYRGHWIVDGFGEPVPCEHCRAPAVATVLTNEQTLEWCDLCETCRQKVELQRERQHEAETRLKRKEV